MIFNKPYTILAAVSIIIVTFSSQAYSGERLKEILSSQVLKVCIWPDYFAISYRNPRTSKLEGIDIDMAHELASYLGVNLKFVDSSFSTLTENLTNNTCDIAMHGVGVRTGRKVYMDFSKPYLISGVYAVGVRDNEDIKNWKDIDQDGVIAVVQKGTYMEHAARSQFKKAEIAVVNSFKAREQEVLSGRADVFMTDYPYGKRMVKLTEWATLLTPPTSFAETQYAYAIPKGEGEWLVIVNKFLAHMKDNGKLAAFARKHGLSDIVVIDQ